MLLTVCMTLSLAACGSKGGSDNSDDAKPSDDASGSASEITVQIGPNPETLDPALNSAMDGANMLITMFETLLIIMYSSHFLRDAIPASARNFCNRSSILFSFLFVISVLEISSKVCFLPHKFYILFKLIVLL